MARPWGLRESAGGALSITSSLTLEESLRRLSNPALLPLLVLDRIRAWRREQGWMNKVTLLQVMMLKCTRA